MYYCLLVLLNLLLHTSVAQTIVYTTGPDGKTSAYYVVSNGTSTSASTTLTTSTSSPQMTTAYATGSSPITSASSLALPTTPYTGQALLTGACSVPVYTALRYDNGHFIEVPLIGCSDDRPECCPSLNLESVTATVTPQSTSTVSGSLEATGIFSLLSQAPLTICPSDMVDIDPVCCPSGFTKWGQAIMGNTPCASQLSTSSYPLPASVSNALTSSIGAALSTATASTTPSVQVIVNTVFALGLPCAEEEEAHGDEAHGLSTAAKAGIGVGAGVGALAIAIALVFAFRKYRRRTTDQPSVQSATASQMTYVPKHDSHMQGSTGWTSPISSQGAGFPGYGQGFVDGVKAAMSPPMAPQSPPPFYGPTRNSLGYGPVEVAAESAAYDRQAERNRVAELSGAHAPTREPFY